MVSVRSLASPVKRPGSFRGCTSANAWTSATVMPARGWRAWWQLLRASSTSRSCRHQGGHTAVKTATSSSSEPPQIIPPEVCAAVDVTGVAWAEPEAEVGTTVSALPITMVTGLSCSRVARRLPFSVTREQGGVGQTYERVPGHGGPGSVSRWQWERVA
jgi:hypothetical protein